MNRSLFRNQLPVFAALAALSSLAGTPRQTYDLSHTDGMESFGGSAAAQEILAKQGFVVAAPQFSQIFQPYIESPLPVLITPDSAWHTYHLLLEKGVKQMELSQSESLVQFSKSLLTNSLSLVGGGMAEFGELARYAAVGLAFQEPAQRAALDAEQRQLVDSLLSGDSSVKAPIGFPLSSVTFRAQSFYAESSKLTAYYHARQWYATVDFRLFNERETRLALCLCWLVQRNPDLLRLWKNLTASYDAMVALPEDGTVDTYIGAAREVLGADFDLAGVQARVPEIQKALAKTLPAPRINDQLLRPDEYLHFRQFTAGFRLLPARQLPCAVCLQNCVEPKISGRLCPSGLDFFAAAPALCSPAALRAEKDQVGKAGLTAVLAADPGSMPSSLYGESMILLSALQKPLPARVPAPFRTEAWSDLQLWTQLGAWAEQRHTWVLHAKPNVEFMGGASPPPGVVEPYPAFFAGLAKLTRRTVDAFASSIVTEKFDARQAAAELRQAQESLKTAMKLYSTERDRKSKELASLEDQLERYGAFLEAFRATHPSGVNFDRSGGIPDDVLKRCAESGPANETETGMLRMFFDARPSVAPPLTNFAAICDRLASLARKELEGKLPTPEEAQWICGYGITLAKLHDYQGNSWLEPQDDFPIISRIFAIPVMASALYAGVARPQALYVILPYKGRQQLYRGAVMSYREFQRPESENLVDESWREMVRLTHAPAAPPFTASFLRADEPDAEQTNRIKAVGFTSSALFKTPVPPSIALAVRQTVFCAKPTEPPPRVQVWIMSADDERHVAYLSVQSGKWRMVWNGKPGKQYDRIEKFTFSPDSRHLVYVGKDARGACLVVDGKEGKEYAEIGPLSAQQEPFEFSADGNHLAYQAKIAPGRECIVMDGAEGPIFDAILSGTFQFSGNSRHFAYAARRGDKVCVLRDNQVALESDLERNTGSPRGPFLSPDGQHLAFMVRRGPHLYVNIDGIDGKSWDDMANLGTRGFSPDGKHFTYTAQRGDRFFTVLDQEERPEMPIQGTVFSPDGRRCAAVHEDETGSWVTVDGVPGKKHAGHVLGMTFSPDGKKLAYWAEGWSASPPEVVLFGEQEFENVDVGMGGGMVFSPDSKHLALLGKRGLQPVAIIDGKQYPRDDRSDLRGTFFTFSPNSKRWAYVACHGGKKYWIISEAQYGPYDQLDEPTPYEEAFGYEPARLFFSPDSRHFAFRITRNHRHFLVVDGFEQPIEGDWFPNSAVVFDTSTKLHFLFMGKENICLVEAEIKPR
jgi:hypothetical protein